MYLSRNHIEFYQKFSRLPSFQTFSMYCSLLFKLCVFFRVINIVQADHYKGGTLSWKVVNPTAISGPTVDIIITERHSWSYDRYPCNATTTTTTSATASKILLFYVQ